MNFYYTDDRKFVCDAR